MVRLSDILKKARERLKKPEPPAQIAGPCEPQPLKYLTPPPEAQKKEEPAQVSEVRIAPVIMKEAKVTSEEENLKLYNELETLIKEILHGQQRQIIDRQRIALTIEKLVDQLSLGDEKIFAVCLSKESTQTNYLICHLVNSCIYAIKIGLGLGYEKVKLIDLGIAGLTFDIGMMKYLTLANQTRKLNPKEYNEVKNHAALGSQILKNIPGLSPLVIDVAYQHHERIDGSGYPRGLKVEAINEFARIVGLADVYEAMVHPRAYRVSFLPIEAIKEILKIKHSFEYKLIKILIERIGIFPIGSRVELNTREIAEIIKLNYSIPLRPVVRVIYGVNGQSLTEAKVLDLNTQPAVYIVGGIRKEGLVFN